MAYFKLRSFDLTELKVSKVYEIGLQRYVAKNKFLYTKIYVYINSKIMWKCYSIKLDTIYIIFT